MNYFMPDEAISSVVLSHDGEKCPVQVDIFGSENGAITLPADVLLSAAHEVSKLLLEPRIYDGHWEAQVSISLD